MKAHAWMLWLVVGLLGTGGALVVSRGWAEETHEVQKKPGEVEKNFDIDKDDEEEVAPESVDTLAGGKIKITTKTFKHPTGWKFKKFTRDLTPTAPHDRRPFNPGQYVDIEIDPECLPPKVEAPTVTVPQDTVDAIKVVVTELTVPPTAGNFPLKCEGNLTPPPGGGGKTEWHWSAKMAQRIITKLTVWKDARPLHRKTLPEGPGDWLPHLMVAGHCQAMLSAKIKMEVETEPPEAVDEVLWRVKIADPANFSANPESGTFANNNPAESELSSDMYREPSQKHDYAAGVGFDGNNNGQLDDDEVAFEVGVHYVTSWEHWRGLVWCELRAFGGIWFGYFAAVNGMYYFLDPLTGPYDWYQLEIPTFACDVPRLPPEKYREGHVDFRGLGVVRRDDMHHAMASVRFAPDSLHGNAIKGTPELARHVIRPKVVWKESEIREYFAEHPAENSHTFAASFFDLRAEVVHFQESGDACFAYGTCGFWPTDLEVTIQRYAEGLGIATATLSGDLYDVYDWSVHASPLDVQAAHEPDCGRDTGVVYQQIVELRNDVYDHGDFSEYYIKE